MALGHIPISVCVGHPITLPQPSLGILPADLLFTLSPGFGVTGNSTGFLMRFGICYEIASSDVRLGSCLGVGNEQAGVGPPRPLLESPSPAHG